MGHKNPDIRIAKSIVDYIFLWLRITFAVIAGRIWCVLHGGVGQNGRRRGLLKVPDRRQEGWRAGEWAGRPPKLPGAKAMAT